MTLKQNTIVFVIFLSSLTAVAKSVFLAKYRDCALLPQLNLPVSTKVPGRDDFIVHSAHSYIRGINVSALMNDNKEIEALKIHNDVFSLDELAQRIEFGINLWNLKFLVFHTIEAHLVMKDHFLVRFGYLNQQEFFSTVDDNVDYLDQGSWKNFSVLLSKINNQWQFTNIQGQSINLIYGYLNSPISYLTLGIQGMSVFYDESLSQLTHTVPNTPLPECISAD
ncbi:MAG: hypothetical protein KDD40_06295 [Bdellovibrionales bacterium]|nr:hypothetical protein [Bdellovibrionales bacterium]